MGSVWGDFQRQIAEQQGELEAQQNNQGREGEQRKGPSIINLLVMGGFMYLMFSGMGKISSFVNPKPPPKAANVYRRNSPALEAVDTSVYSNALTKNQELNLRVYTSLAKMPGSIEDLDFMWERNVTYGFGQGDFFNETLNITLPKSVTAHNQSFYAHIFLGPYDVVAASQLFPVDAEKIIYRRENLNRYLKPIVGVDRYNLLQGNDTDRQQRHDAMQSKRESQMYNSYWIPDLTLYLVYMEGNLTKATIPQMLQNHISLQSQTKRYQPPFVPSQFWHIRSKYIELNESLTHVPLEVTFRTLSSWKMTLMTQIDFAMDFQTKTLGATEDESSSIKTVILEANPYLLAITMVVNVLHSVFQYLAFKHEISFWRTRDNLQGLSIQSLFTGAFCDVVIFLYLLDSEETGFVIAISGLIQCVISFWKITKAVKVTIVKTSYGLPWPKFTNKTSYVASSTKEYDEFATYHLIICAIPLIAGYSLYSLKYDEFKSWSSWVIRSLVSSVYLFGFILMTPQLFINYKLKSVAHMPWKAMMYKFLNTFVDDLGSFVMPMPIMHRIACFRDGMYHSLLLIRVIICLDIIFFIYIFQKWKYPVDLKRVNEFGSSFEIDEADKRIGSGIHRGKKDKF